MIDSYMSVLNRYDDRKHFFTYARFGSFVLNNNERFARKNRELYSCAQFLLFPINVNGNHWSFVYADATDANNKTFGYVDTLKESEDIVIRYGSKTKQINAIDEVMKFWCLIKNEEMETVKKWRILRNEFPKQPDFVSCGFLVCEFAKYVMLKWQPPNVLTEQYVEAMRKNIAYEIMTKNILC